MRGHGLLSGWLDHTSLFAYQITYDGQPALHGRKRTESNIIHTPPSSRTRAEWDRRLDAVHLRVHVMDGEQPSCFGPAAVARKHVLECLWRRVL